ncbi:hypothetical protein ACFLT1_09170 [Bacteroidota bacterium]
MVIIRFAAHRRLLPLVFVLICVIFPYLELEGQVRSQENKKTWSWSASYSPAIAGMFSDSASKADENIYYSGLSFGLQYHASNSLLVTTELGLKHKRIIFPVYLASTNDSIEGANHLGYMNLSAGIEYRPFSPENRIKPFIGASISPTYFYSHHRVVSDRYILDYTKLKFLLMTHIEAGFYYHVKKKMDIRFSVLGGYNLVSDWRSFIMLQSRLGICFKF